MPYDSAKTRQLLTIVGGYSNHPSGEYISELGKQLTDAEAEITIAVNAKVKAEADANRYASEVSTLQSTVRQLHDQLEAMKPVAAPAPAVTPPIVVPLNPPPAASTAPVVKRTRKTKTPTTTAT